jgi:hypothetical protein
VTRVALLAIALWACGDNVDATPPHDGARLRQIDYVFDDGTRATDRDTFFDEDLQAQCRATDFSDGARYCMPTTAWGDTVFVDDRCSMPRGFLVNGEVVPSYFISHHTLHDTTLPSHLYRAAQPVEQPSLVWRVEDNMCIGPEQAQLGMYYAVDGELTTDGLVRIRERSRISGERLEVGVDTSSDGLVAFGRVYDPIVGPCALTSYPNADQAMCVPDDTTALWYFADAACTQLLVAHPTSTSLERAVWFDPTSSCATLVDVGDPVQLDTVYEILNGRCVRGSVPSVDELHATSPAASDVARVSRVIAPSDRRLSLLDLVDGALAIPSPRLLDHDLDGECALEWTGDELRCVPLASSSVSTVFADPSCSTTLDLAFVHRGACDPPPRFASVLDTRRRIEAPYTATFFQLDTGDTCGVLPPPSGYGAYSVGPILLPEDFARATIEIRSLNSP